MRKKIRHLAYLCLLSFGSFAQPVADFSTSSVAGCAPMMVHFQDLSSGNPTSWFWDLGNGTVSYLQNPSVSYLRPGTYTVRLTVQNSAGTSTAVKNQIITVYPKPSVDFGSSATSGCPPLDVYFSDSSRISAGSLVRWLWDFGDGYFDTIQSPAHTYRTAGNFNVSLRVTSDIGCSNSITKPFYVRIGQPVSADFQTNLASACILPATVNFTNLTTGRGSMQFSWDFGDGNVSGLTNPTHAYDSNGTFQVRLISFNSSGCSDTVTKNLTIAIGRNSASFNTSGSLCKGEDITFINQSNPAPVSSYWDFGNGNTSSQQSPTFSYNAPGNYFVKLVCDFGGCRDSVTNMISIGSKPIAGFTASDTVSCKAPHIVRFRNQSRNSSTYIWDFGDGNSSTDPNPTHTYIAAGLYTITLISINNGGCRDTIVRNNLVRITPPEARIENLPQTGCAPFTWRFSSRFTGIEPAYSYLWDFGDGTTSTQASPTHTFDSGTYTIRLIITTAGGCTDTAEALNGIRVGVTPDANFTATPRNTCADFAVNFTDSSRGNVTRWIWNFGDGGVSNQPNPIYTYSDTGFFTVTLIVFNNGCPDTLIIPEYIYINPPIARMSFSIDCRNKFARSFRGDRSIGADEYFWDFGDGNTSNVPNPTHIYSAAGIYTVILKVRNLSSGCESIMTRSLNIITEFADFQSPVTEACRNTRISFEAVNSNSSNIRSYHWSFGDGNTGSGRTVSNLYSRSGTYNIRLIITDVLGCRDTMTKPYYIRINGPTASFTANISRGCLNSNINFIDNSVSDSVNPIISREWNFGDGTILRTDSTSVSHGYSTTGSFTVRLTITDSKGCTSQRVDRNLIVIGRPIASFHSPDTLSCPGMTVGFVNSSSGTGLSFEWDFGDGTRDTGISPTHIYSEEGNFSVKLIVTDRFGCKDSIIRSGYMKSVYGRAEFTPSDTLGNCPPLIVDFQNNSSNSVSYYWDFGDGTNSSLPNPSHFFATAGEFVVKLRARSIGGCYSQYERIITVMGPSGRFNYSPLNGCKPLRVSFSANTRNASSIEWDFDDGNTVQTIDSAVSHIYSYQGKYLPRMILTSSNGCRVSVFGPDTISVNGSSAGFNFSQNTFCDSSKIEFFNTTVSTDSILSYNWQFGQENASSTMRTPDFQYSIPGTYYPSLTVTTINGCVDSIRSSIPVRLFASPRIVIERSPNGCIPLTVNINGRVENPDTLGIQWNWNLGNGQTTGNQQPGNVDYADSGNYLITAVAINTEGCADSASTAVEAYGIPVVEVGEDLINCYGSATALNATGTFAYQWTPSAGLSCTNCPNPTVRPDSSKMYIVTGFSEKGCSAKDSVLVTVKYPFEMTASRPDSVCQGESVFMYAQGAYDYSWTPTVLPMGQHNSVVTVKPETSTIYRVTGTDDANCFSRTIEIPITVFPIPTVEAGEDVTIAVGRTIDLTPEVSSDVTEINWSPTGSIYRSAYPSITVKPRVTTEYTVEVANQGGCTATDQLTVYVTCEGSNVFLPNTFTPNQDGMNDVFYPRGSGLFRIKSMRVFNRWGEVVFLRNDFMPNNASAGWDGTYKGKPLNPDVYVYMIEIICDNNAILIHKGNIALLK